MSKFFKFTILVGVIVILVIAIGALLIQPGTSQPMPTSTAGQATQMPGIYDTPACDGLPECGYIRMHSPAAATPEP